MITVHNKEDLVPLARALAESDCELIATGGTAKALLEVGLAVTSVESITGSPEMLGGRVKTLHPSILGAILADPDLDSHLSDIERMEIEPIDLVIVNLYPFEAIVSKGAAPERVIEEIDIGGVTLLRSAAKNHKRVTVISDPNQYENLISNLYQGFTLEERKSLAGKAFGRTCDYESAISSWFAESKIIIQAEKVDDLRYGENPHQSATLYRFSGSAGIAAAEKLNGKEMSFNNYLDAEAAIRLVNDHTASALSIVKHSNPCGIAVSDDPIDAYRKALSTDPVSAFGGIVGSNVRITAELAVEIMQTYTEVVVAPAYDDAALEAFGKNTNIRVLLVSLPLQETSEFRSISGGILRQRVDRYSQGGDDPSKWQLVAGQPANPKLLQDLEFAWRSIRAVRSNAILIAKDRASVGIGIGQVNRLNSARLAVASASSRARGAVAASDAFFPFPDGLEVLIEAGVNAVVQPGGSKRDEEVIAVARNAGLTMYFTGVRHFSH